MDSFGMCFWVLKAASLNLRFSKEVLDAWQFWALSYVSQGRKRSSCSGIIHTVLFRFHTVMCRQTEPRLVHLVPPKVLAGDFCWAFLYSPGVFGILGAHAAGFNVVKTFFDNVFSEILAVGHPWRIIFMVSCNSLWKPDTSWHFEAVRPLVGLANGIGVVRWLSLAWSSCS